jgi:HlyD family secretion protein
LKNKMLNDSLQLARKRSLWSQNIGSKVELEQAELNYSNSKTTYESARLRYKDEKRRLEIASKQALKSLQISRKTESDFTITSNTNGKIYSLTSEEGEMVNTQTPLAVIGDARDYKLELQVDEYDVTSIRPGQSVKVVMDSYKGEVFEAVVTKVNPIMNERTKTLTVEADFVTSPPALYPNLTLEANIILQVKDNVLTLPRKFVINDRFVIKENGDTILVTVGLKDYLKAEIVNGVDENDVLILPE